MAFRSNLDQHPLNLESMKCSGKYCWERSITISEDVLWT